MQHFVSLCLCYAFVCMYLVAFTGHMWTFSPWQSSFKVVRTSLSFNSFFHTAYYCSGLTTEVVYSILDNIAMGWSDTGSERSVVIQDWGWERAGDWVVIVKVTVRSCGLEQSVGGQRSVVYMWMSWTSGTNVAQSLGGEMTAANSWRRSKSVGAATLSVVGSYKESEFKIKKDQTKLNCWRAGVALKSK